MPNFNRDRGSGGGFHGGGDRKFGSRPAWGRVPSDRGPAQMFRATCEDCGNSCEVPFRPNGSKPVYCRECFPKHGGGESRRFGTQDSIRTSFEEKKMYRATCDKCGGEAEVPFRPTGEKPVYCRACFGGKGGSTESRGGENYAEQFKQLNAKLDAILRFLTPVTIVTPTKEQKTAAPVEAVTAKPAKKQEPTVADEAKPADKAATPKAAKAKKAEGDKKTAKKKK